MSREYSIGNLDRLPWRTLARICSDTLVPAHHRKLAERRLTLKIEGMALGEQVALSRVAPHGALAGLARLRQPAVFLALLGNPWLTNDDITAFLQDPEQSPDLLRLVAENHRWGETVPIRTLLVCHRSTPVHTALTVLAALPEKVVRRLLDEGSLPPVVAIQAERLHVGKTE